MNKFENVDKDLRICVYCYNTTFAYVCPTCNEYDGLMPITQETEDYLGEDLLGYLDWYPGEIQSCDTPDSVVSTPQI